MPVHPHCHWRSSKEWSDLGFKMSTTSDEACKLYDASLTQLVSGYNDDSVGGVSSCIDKMITADPNFVLGHVVKLEAMGRRGKRTYSDVEYAHEIDKMVELAKQPHVSPWERQHAAAVKHFAEGKIDQALTVWEDILLDNPKDMLSIKYTHDMFAYTGNPERARNVWGRVLSYWKPDNTMYGDVLALYSFGLEETNLYSEAEKTAYKALEFNRHDPWAHHCIAHCQEMTGRYEEGLKFMLDSENSWKDSMLAYHIYWHWGLFHLEKGDFESAVALLDDKILPPMKNDKSMFSLADVASLGFRLEAEGYNLGDRWNDCHEIIKSQKEDDRVWSYWDINSALACIGAQKNSDINLIIKSVKDFIQNGYGDNRIIYNEVTLPVLEACQAYNDEQFDLAVELMKPVRCHANRVGGSVAQRDILNMFTIHAALRSKRSEHQKYARHLLHERQSLRGDTPLIGRLMKRVEPIH